MPCVGRGTRHEGRHRHQRAGLGVAFRRPSRGYGASRMRPGQKCPGNHALVHLALHHVVGFNEAGAGIPWKNSQPHFLNPVRDVASMRPGQECPGKRRRTAQGPARAAASMRPGQECPGKRRSFQRVSACTPRASMRPGQECPGKPCASRPRSPSPLSFNEAGAGMPRKTSRGARPAPVALTRFNEAGAGMPRKTRVHLRRTQGQPGASMRPGQECPGKHFTSVRTNPFNIASMRPGQECPGKRRGDGEYGSARTSFNEAGAGMPRKTRYIPHLTMRLARFNEAGAGMPRKTLGLIFPMTY